MRIIIALALAVLLFGCCGPVTSYSGKTYDASCRKSCNALAAEYAAEGIPINSGECVAECRAVLRSEGINPDSSCPPDMTVVKVCEIDCRGNYGCMQECLRMMREFTGLDPDDCVVPF